MNAKASRKHMRVSYARMCKQLANKPTEKQVRLYRKAFKKWSKKRTGPKPIPPRPWLELEKET